MQIDIKKKEFRRLLDMVYIGNWILNSTRGDDRFADYDDLESKLFALCRGNGMDALREELIALAEPGGHFFSEDTLTDQPERVIASEIVREQIHLKNCFLVRHRLRIDLFCFDTLIIVFGTIRGFWCRPCAGVKWVF